MDVCVLKAAVRRLLEERRPPEEAEELITKHLRALVPDEIIEVTVARKECAAIVQIGRGSMIVELS